MLPETRIADFRECGFRVGGMLVSNALTLFLVPCADVIVTRDAVTAAPVDASGLRADTD